MADSTQNKMILYRLSENLCLQQRRKEERGPLTDPGGAGSAKLPGPEPQGGHCLVALCVPLNSEQPRGDGTCVSQPLGPYRPRRWLLRSGADTGSKRGPPFLSSHARETACSTAGSWQLSGVASYWILLCISEREAVAEMIKLSSIWTKERIL